MKRFRTLFTKPFTDHRPWVIWTWNLKVNRALVERQLALLADSSVAGIAVEPGRDMDPAFLSEDFVKLFERVLSAAQQRGIGVRLVCDLSLPWTTGLSQELWRRRSLRAARLVLEQSERVAAKTKVERTYEDPADVLVVAARLYDGRVRSLAECKPLRLNKGQLSWIAPPGEWQVLVFRKQFERHAGDGFVPNVYSSECGAAYANTVLRPLRDRLARYMSGTFRGVITEVPHTMPREGSIPWDDDLAVKYRSRFKKDLIALLPVLFLDVEEGLTKHRPHVYTYLQDAMYERFCGAVETWLRKHRMSQWVLGSERNPAAPAGALRDFFAVPSGAFAAAGIQCQNGQEEDLALAAMASAANQLQWRRQTVAVAGRSLDRVAPSLQSLRNEIDIALAGGASQVLIDGFACNLDARASGKAGFGPFWYSSDCPALKPLCESAGALRTCLDKLLPAPQVAVLSPAMSLYAEYRPGSEDPVKRAGTALRRVVRTLRESNIEFDILSEEFLLTCGVRQNGEFGAAGRVRKSNYRVLVVPYARLISKALLVFVEKLAAHKGQVVFIDEAPQADTDGTAGFAERFAKLMELRKGHIHTVPARDLMTTLAGIEPAATALVNNAPCTDIQVRRLSGGAFDLYVLRNGSTTQDYYVSLSLPGRRRVSIVQCDRREIHEHPGAKTSEGKAAFGLFFSPQQTHVVVVSSAALPLTKVNKERRRAYTITTVSNRSYRMVLKNQWVFLPISPNILPLTGWNMRVGLSRESGGFAHFYETTFFVNEIPQRCYLALSGVPLEPAEHGGLDKCVELTVNGTRLPLAPGAAVPGCSSDPLYAVFGDVAVCDLRGRLIAGVNRIIMRTTGAVSDPLPVTYPLLLAGDFSVKKDSRGWVVDEPLQEILHDSWTLHGFPHLSGVGEYRHVFEVPNKYNGLVLRFSALSGSVNVCLNDTEVGSAWWQPLELDVTDYCTLKRNELRLRVTNTIDNLLRLNGRLSGVLGEAYVDVY